MKLRKVIFLRITRLVNEAYTFHHVTLSSQSQLLVRVMDFLCYLQLS